MKEIHQLHQLHQTKKLTEIHMLLQNTKEINIPLPTLRAWYYQQRHPSPQNLQKLRKALQKINHTPQTTTLAIRTTPNDPTNIYTTGTANGTATILDQQIQITNHKLNKNSNPTLHHNLHHLLTKYPNKWLRVC